MMKIFWPMLRAWLGQKTTIHGLQRRADPVAGTGNHPGDTIPIPSLAGRADRRGDLAGDTGETRGVNPCPSAFPA